MVPVRRSFRFAWFRFASASGSVQFSCMCGSLQFGSYRFHFHGSGSIRKLPEMIIVSLDGFWLGTQIEHVAMVLVTVLANGD